MDPGDPLLLQIQAYADPLARGPAVLEQLAAAPPPDEPEGLVLLGTASCLCGDFHRAHSLLGPCVAQLREQQRLRVLTQVMAVRAWAAIMTSDYRLALAAAQEAVRLAAETAQPVWGAASWTAQAVLAALHGDQPAVDRLTARVEEIMLPAGAAAPLSLVQYARGLLALSQGRHADAYDELHRIYSPGDPACNHRNQLAAIGDLAEAAIRSGHQDQARQILERVRPLAGQAPWPRAAARYAAALLADHDHAEAAYREVLTRDLSPWPFTRARLHLVYGEWLRRQRRPADSRTHLRAAGDAFDALGTTPWSERAGRELRASGETNRHRTNDSVDQLTPQELQIIALAADGLSNREIGQRLCLSHRTVESHLYRVFPKLGVTSRSQLPHVLTRLPAQRSQLTSAPDLRGSEAAETAAVVVFPLALLVLVDAVDADGDGDEQGVVRALLDLHPVGVPDPEPAPRDPAHDVVAVLQLPVLVGEVADGLKPGPSGEVDLVPVLDRREERRADGSDDPAAVFDLHRVAHGEDLLADDDEQVAVGVLELEGLTEAEGLPVDDEDAVAVGVLDPKVCPEGENPFLD